MKFKSNYKNEYTSTLKELLQKGELVEVEEGLFFVALVDTEKLNTGLNVISKDTRNDLNTFSNNKK